MALGKPSSIVRDTTFRHRMLSDHIRHRLRAGAVHLALSVLIAGIASWLVFVSWYPPPFAAIAGGTQLFLLLVSVDIVVGPALTTVVASPGKRRDELTRDLIVIVALQFAAFGYGLHSLALARPVALVYEIAEFRIVSAADIEVAGLSQAPPNLRELSWRGPRLMAAAKPIDPQELLRVVELGIAGIPLAAMPYYWREYPAYADGAWRVARPVTALTDKYPSSASALARMAASIDQPAPTLRFLPLRVRRAEWVAILAAPDSRIVGYLPLDGFF